VAGVPVGPVEVQQVDDAVAGAAFGACLGGLQDGCGEVGGGCEREGVQVVVQGVECLVEFEVHDGR
jgi:hypothetical protein